MVLSKAGNDSALTVNSLLSVVPTGTILVTDNIFQMKDKKKELGKKFRLITINDRQLTNNLHDIQGMFVEDEREKKSFKHPDQLKYGYLRDLRDLAIYKIKSRQ